jgi:cell division protein FtsW
MEIHSSKPQIKRNTIDIPFLVTVAILVVIGCIMIISTSSVIGFASYNNSYIFIKKHFIYLILGTMMLILGTKIQHTVYKKMLLPGFIASIVLLLLTFMPGIGIKAGGANRWIDMVFFQLQPVEFAKFIIILYLATYLENKRESLKSFISGVMPILVFITLFILILFKQPDLGNVMLILIISAIIMFISEIKLAHLFATGFAAMIAVGINIYYHPYQLQRITSFLFPQKDPLGANYHVLQSLMAIGSGGFFGLGIGQSKLKYFYLPLQYSDFIFSILCEEGGLILGYIVIALFAVLLYKGISISVNSGSEYSKYLGIGLTLMLVVQAIINIGVVIGVFPVTGITLTFISFGGSSLITSMFYSGVILNISKNRIK